MTERKTELYTEDGNWVGFRVEDLHTGETRDVWWGGKRPLRVFTKPLDARQAAAVPRHEADRLPQPRPVTPRARPQLRVVIEEQDQVPPAPEDVLGLVVERQKALGLR